MGGRLRVGAQVAAAGAARRARAGGLAASSPPSSSPTHAADFAELDALCDADEPFALFFEPPTLDERIANQAAVLSVISDPTCHMDTWLDEHPDAWRAWRIPVALKREIRDRLDQAQITERVLMPGLDGLAAYLRRYYSPQSVTLPDGQGATMDDAGPGPQHEGSMA